MSTFPQGQPVIDLMLAIAVSADNREWYESMRPLLMDEESRTAFKMPAQYLFKDIPAVNTDTDRLSWTIAEMDRFNISRAMTPFNENNEAVLAAHERHRDRFLFELGVNPNQGMEAVRAIRRARREYGIDAVSVFPAGLNPQVPINDKRMYPIYAACVEEGLPICMTVGVPGPRLPAACQDVHLVDEVCWFFPELTFVMRHGAEPHEAMAVKLMLKYQNLYYSTSAFAPKHYPKAIVDFMNTRGAHKVCYAGYFPMGLTLDRIFGELADLPLRPDVWPKFLHDNAAGIFGAGANSGARQ
jgi:predicted TIM-barrel fold metal-dependent hydrolase